MIDLLNPKFSQSHPEVLERPPEEKERVPAKKVEGIFSRFWGLKNWKLFICLFLSFLVPLALIYLFVINPVMAVYTKAMGMKEPFSRFQEAIDQKDLVLADQSLRQVESELWELKDLYRRLGYLEIVPVINSYYRDGKHLLEAISFSLEGGRIIIESVSPFGNVLGIAQGFEGYLTTEEQAANLAAVLPQIAPQIDTALGKLFLTKAELEQIDPSRYPEDIRDIKLKFWLEESQKILSEFEPLLAEAKSIVEILPHFLGIPERTYLILFQNDAELRATGGFITYYALVTLGNGKIVSSDFMSGALVHKNQPYEYPPEPIRKYLGVRTWHLQDSNFSPDFPTSTAILISMWEKSKLPDIEGVIAITSGSARKILELTGPIRLAKYDLDLADTNLPDDCRVGGESFTSSNFICRLEYYVERYTRGGTERKKAILSELSQAVIRKITSFSMEIWPQLLDLTFNLLDQKDILLYSTDAREQELIEDLGFAGQIKDYEGDYLHISDSNFGGKKTDLYMRETVEQNLTRRKDGRWRKTVNISYYNPQPHDNWLSANYKDFVRIYVPRGSKLVRVEGANQEWGSWTELGKTVFGAYFTLWPQKKHTLTFVYDLPSGDLIKDARYRLLMQKQPGANITLVKVKIGGKMKSFNIKTDKEIEIALE